MKVYRGRFLQKLRHEMGCTAADRGFCEGDLMSGEPAVYIHMRVAEQKKENKVTKGCSLSSVLGGILQPTPLATSLETI